MFLFGHDPFLFPTLSAGLQAFVRSAYGALLLLTLAAALPQARRYFQSERWGGYAQSSAWVDAVQNPYVGPWLLAGTWPWRRASTCCCAITCSSVCAGGACFAAWARQASSRSGWAQRCSSSSSRRGTHPTFKVSRC